MLSRHILVCVLVLCFVLISSIADAEQRSTGNQALKPLQQPLIANKTTAPSSYQLLLLTLDNAIAARTDLNNTICCPAPADILMSGYRDYINSCLTKSYSVQDQQAAGCAGTDTVNQCMDKLYKHCIAAYKGEYGTKEAFRNQFKTDLDRSNNINSKSKRYSDLLQTILNSMP